jgi:spermidine synthase
MSLSAPSSLPAARVAVVDTQPTAGLPLSWFFFFFLVSGFCSVLYELIWLRLAMAQFGVTSALVSIVLSTFMAGLGLGSWASGVLLRKRGDRVRNPVRLYALTELLIGASAVLVPYELAWGRRLLEVASISASWVYYAGSAVSIALTLVPWCACMGATIPLGMLAIRRQAPQASKRSFSFLYLANVLGAVGGAIVPLLLIELHGFHRTLIAGAVLNATIAIIAWTLTLKAQNATLASSKPFNDPIRVMPATHNWRSLFLLFTTGMTCMGIEVVWIRQFTPYLGTVVYAFATILAFYLISTYSGSQIYRRWSLGHTKEPAFTWTLVGVAALFPLLTTNPQIHISSFTRVLLGIGPLSLALGFITPMLVDRWSGGDPDQAGKAYAINVLGCIVGPIVAGFVLLPLIGERWVLFIFALPWLFLGPIPVLGIRKTSSRTWLQKVAAWAVIPAAVFAVFLSRSFEDAFPHRVVLRDNTATVIATGEGMRKRLLINGVGITSLTPITKFMAHMPLAFLDHRPQNALVVCFGMGTTFRSLLSWNIPATAVDLVPSVPRVFWYYHSDAPELLASPQAHVVVDDGRRFLERTAGQYDVITIDPPPPVSAAGSSLLYSREFYSVIKRRLRPNGILQQWLPYGDAVVQSSVARALSDSFAYVRVFHSVEGSGFHFLASERPLPSWTSDQLVQHMPASAIADLMEWGPTATPELQFSRVLKTEFSLEEMIQRAPEVPALQDDRPMNEYYILRSRRSR